MGNHKDLRTLKEIKIVQVDTLKHIQYTENLMKLQAGDSFSTLKTTITYITLKKSLMAAISHMLQKIIK